jgi:hypothetical protein
MYPERRRWSTRLFVGQDDERDPGAVGRDVNFADGLDLVEVGTGQSWKGSLGDQA